MRQFPSPTDSHQAIFARSLARRAQRPDDGSATETAVNPLRIGLFDASPRWDIFTWFDERILLTRFGGRGWSFMA
jgi:hypothetical protein